ncbi:hypothetical protein KIPB_009753, partial [Kipferlia bialata]|eukprot:g9753.t1
MCAVLSEGEDGGDVPMVRERDGRGSPAGRGIERDPTQPVVQVHNIHWHSSGVLSVSTHPSGRVATSGSDGYIRIWKMHPDGKGGVYAEFRAAFEHHKGVVNVVRFSPNGRYLATASDGGDVFLWRLEADATADEDNKEVWRSRRHLRGNTSDVYALGWSPDSTHLASGAVDASIRIWRLSKR